MVLQKKIFTSIVVTVVCIVGLFVIGEFRDMKNEDEKFTMGTVSYYMTLIWSAIGWQVCSVGRVGLIFLVSSLFSNVISTLALPNESSIGAKSLAGISHIKLNKIKTIKIKLNDQDIFPFNESVASQPKTDVPRKRQLKTEYRISI